MVNKFFFLSLYHREQNWHACMEHSRRNGNVCHQTSHIRWWWWWWLDEDERRQYVTVVVITAEHCNELGCWVTVQRVAVVIVTEQCSDFCYEISLSLAAQPVHLLQSYNQTPTHTHTHTRLTAPFPAVPPRPQDGTVSVIVLFTIVFGCMTDCNLTFNTVRCPCNWLVREVSP